MNRALVLLLALTACTSTPPEPEGPSLGDQLGVPRGALLFSNARTAEEFDGHVERFAPVPCLTLNSAIAALNAQPSSSGTTRRLANVGGAVLPGVAGSLTRVIGSELAANAAQKGNIQLSAAEAVHSAKGCEA